MADSSLTEIFGEPISVYTRAQAIADGVLVDLSALAPDVCAQHYKYPVACTAAVWAIVDAAVKHPRWMNDLKGVVHDLLWMSRARPVQRMGPSQVLFEVIVRGAGRQSVFTFKMVCGPGDDASPVMTLMLPEED